MKKILCYGLNQSSKWLCPLSTSNYIDLHCEIFFFISRDPSYFEYVDKIGQHFFGLPAPQRPQGMFSGLLDSIFSAMNEDDSEEGETNNSVQMDLDWFCYFFLFWGLKVWIMQKSFVIK